MVFGEPQETDRLRKQSPSGNSAPQDTERLSKLRLEPFLHTPASGSRTGGREVECRSGTPSPERRSNNGPRNAEQPPGKMQNRDKYPHPAQISSPPALKLPAKYPHPAQISSPSSDILASRPKTASQISSPSAIKLPSNGLEVFSSVQLSGKNRIAGYACKTRTI